MDLLVEIYKTISAYCAINGYGELFVWGVISIGAVALLGIAIGWFLGKRNAVANLYKTYAETKKVKTEEKVQFADLLKRVDERRDELRDQRVQMDAFLKDVLEVLRERKVRILKGIRDDVCAINSNEYMPALQNYLDDCVLLLPKNVRTSRIVGEILPSLRQQRKLFTVLNHAHFFDKIKHAGKYQMDRNARDILFSNVKKCVPFLHRRTRKQIANLKRDFEEFTKPYGV